MINPLSVTYSLQLTTISNFAAFSKLKNEAWYFMRIVCQQKILMKCLAISFSKIRNDAQNLLSAAFEIGASRDNEYCTVSSTCPVILLPAHPASFAHKFLFQRVPGCNSMADLSLKIVFWTH